MGHAQVYKGRKKGDDPDIDTAQTPKRLDRHLPLLEKIRKTFADSIPSKPYQLSAFPVDIDQLPEYQSPHVKDSCLRRTIFINGLYVLSFYSKTRCKESRINDYAKDSSEEHFVKIHN